MHLGQQFKLQTDFNAVMYAIRHRFHRTDFKWTEVLFAHGKFKKG